MKIDLHCHSHYSDGKHEPAFLVDRARANGVTHLAITDHDCTAAFEGQDWSETSPRVIAGVEISCDWNGREIHVAGLFIDPRNATLQELLGNQCERRRERIEQMDRRLNDLGVEGLSRYMAATACRAPTRSHVADFLVQHGVCKNRQKAFKNYLGKRGRAYVETAWCYMEQAVEAILHAGGIPVLAHPGRYPLGRANLVRLIDEFAESGGEALEGSYGNIDRTTQSRLCELAIQKEMYISAGSDFHDAEAHWTDIGKYPGLDEEAKKNAIWGHPGWHSSLS